MSPLDQWRELAEQENARMREACENPLAKTPDHSGDPRVVKARERWQHVIRLHNEGYGPTEIGRRLDTPTTTIATDLKKLRARGEIE